MKKIIKYFLLIVFLLDFNVQVEAKPVPPGSGEGDVAANIIFLIDRLCKIYVINLYEDISNQQIFLTSLKSFSSKSSGRTSFVFLIV